MGVFLQLPLLTAPPISVPQVARRLEPTIVNIKPRLPSWFLKSKEPEKRREYCRVKLLLHKPFLNTDDFHSYMETHGNDYEAAYEHFARHDPHAPSHVKDDFRELHIETDDGERLQPLLAIIPSGPPVQPILRRCLASGELRWLTWLSQVPHQRVRLPVDALVNVNGPEDLSALVP